MPKYTVGQFEEAIPKSGGVIATIARRVGCDWHTADKFIRKHDKLAQMLEDECQTIDDLAESVLIKAMQEGDVGSARWWLERRRRGRYATRQEVTGADAGPMVINLSWGDSGEMNDGG